MVTATVNVTWLGQRVYHLCIHPSDYSSTQPGHPSVDRLVSTGYAIGEETARFA